MAAPTDEVTEIANSCQEASDDAEGARCQYVPCTDQASSVTQVRKRTADSAALADSVRDEREMPPPKKRPRKLSTNRDATASAVAADEAADSTTDTVTCDLPSTDAADDDDRARVFAALEILQQHPRLTAEVASEAGAYVADALSAAANAATKLASPFNTNSKFAHSFTDVFSAHVMPYIDARSASALRVQSRKFRTIVEDHGRPCFQQIVCCLASPTLCARAPALVERYIRDCNPWASEVFGIAMSAMVRSGNADMGAEVLHVIARNSLLAISLGNTKTARTGSQHVDDADVAVSDVSDESRDEHKYAVMNRELMDKLSARYRLSISSSDAADDDPAVAAESEEGGVARQVSPMSVVSSLTIHASAKSKWEDMAGKEYGGYTLAIESQECDFCLAARKWPAGPYAMFFLGPNRNGTGSLSGIRQSQLGSIRISEAVTVVQRVGFSGTEYLVGCSDALRCSRMSPALIHAALLYGVYAPGMITAPHRTDDVMMSICCAAQTLSTTYLVDIEPELSAVRSMLGMPGVVSDGTFLSAPQTGNIVASSRILAPLIPALVDAGLRIGGRTATGKSLIMCSVTKGNSDGLGYMAPLSMADGLPREMQKRAVQSSLAARDWAAVRILINNGFCVHTTCIADFVHDTPWFLDPNQRAAAFLALLGDIHVWTADPSRISAVVSTMYAKDTLADSQAAGEFICALWRAAKKKIARKQVERLVTHQSFYDMVVLGVVRQLAVLSAASHSMSLEVYTSLGIDTRPRTQAPSATYPYKPAAKVLAKLVEVHDYATSTLPATSVTVTHARGLHTFIEEAARGNWSMLCMIADTVPVVLTCLTAAVVYTDNLIYTLFAGDQRDVLCRRYASVETVSGILRMATVAAGPPETATARMARRLLRWCAMFKCRAIPPESVDAEHYAHIREIAEDLVVPLGRFPLSRGTWQHLIDALIDLAIKASDGPGLDPIERLFVVFHGDLGAMLQHDVKVRAGLNPGTEPTGDAREVLSYCVASVCINVGTAVPDEVMEPIVENTIGVEVACVGPVDDTSGKAGGGMRGHAALLRGEPHGFWYWKERGD